MNRDKCMLCGEESELDDSVFSDLYGDGAPDAFVCDDCIGKIVEESKENRQEAPNPFLTRGRVTLTVKGRKIIVPSKKPSETVLIGAEGGQKEACVACGEQTEKISRLSYDFDGDGTLETFVCTKCIKQMITETIEEEEEPEKRRGVKLRRVKSGRLVRYNKRRERILGSRRTVDDEDEEESKERKEEDLPLDSEDLDEKETVIRADRWSKCPKCGEYSKTFLSEESTLHPGKSKITGCDNCIDFLKADAEGTSKQNSGDEVS